ncbi:HlyD family secretion protein [Pseudoxanthomonas sacheonensis]|uniref:HlyD family secretion protein n=1 Tax=Pseudoxanthomonas sacheonensis TaxID=443615 RepID=UPI0013D27A5D|nr:HlyD family efflux transporter periplasmic adaptor subunit [Pseudoxanthomonas sacheonensis]KAF1708335.1 hypothetical protein CSC73_08610 [Pseudoxanthomonas sacheonensis]
MNRKYRTWILRIIAVAVVAAAAVMAWRAMQPQGPGPGFVSGNGRIEATEIDVAAKTGGRLREVMVDEGEFVVAGQILARMDTQTLQAQRDEAVAQRAQARTAVATARFQVAQQQSQHEAAVATVAQYQAALDAARQRLQRTRLLAAQKLVSQQAMDDALTEQASAIAALATARAQTAAASAAIETAGSQVIGAESATDAATAAIARIDAEIDDATLRSPRDGRVQYRIAQPDEVLGSGGKVLNLVDLSDVYMTFFLPETVAGKVALGSEVRILLDAAPDYVIPATVSFVASTAQFTPKTVETASERQKLMFRVKAKIGRELLKKHIAYVKTGVPGVAWLKLDEDAQWPAELAVRLPE